ncbi:single-stranded-DNA-specific exonuclease [Sphingomonas jejuensis]|uniref:Single-stranded-DNA-specific exonuclease n=1 Tax=Sphingomonas jejuensis TaxID=904715 RepID=A0ABX0XMH3_9SPHN|nr:DHH family phosphoesterase [Sphingomonas jejuensis]NJC34578.1 single-stranded-DNA-specific exonuclease [Sphingomonas jejuensis]
MIGALAHATDLRTAARETMTDALDRMDQGRPVVVLSHFDADGLGAAAILVRALGAAGRTVVALVTGKGETPWDDAVRARLQAHDPGGLILADLGTRAEPVLPGCPTIVIDHHVPTGAPEGAITLSGNGLDPEPTTALLAWWAAGALGQQDDLLWLAAIGLIGDMAEDRGFPELAAAQARWGKTALRDATSLVNAPRRTAAADPGPALRLLLAGDGPKHITKGDDADADALRNAKAEVRAAMEVGRRVAPMIAGDVALIPLDSPCQIHPLIAQQWRGRLKDKIVLAANRGYRDGWVHFAARSASGRNLINFLAEHRPPGADSRYGNGHAQATGGALTLDDWNSFIAGLGLPAARIADAGGG